MMVKNQNNGNMLSYIVVGRNIKASDNKAWFVRSEIKTEINEHIIKNRKLVNFFKMTHKKEYN